MKSIELTEKHKSKLLEMCNKLFKKEIHGLTIQDNGFLNYSDTSKSVDYDDKIHWFQFCMTELVEKILNPTPLKPSRGLQDKFKKFFWKTNHYWMHHKFNKNSENASIEPLHPVDYLYKEFKKLK